MDINNRKKEIRSLWEEDLERAFDKTNKTDSQLFMDILTIVVFNRFNGNIGKLYKIINNMEMFTTIIETFSDLSLRFPDSKEFKDSITLAIVYYYREVQKLPWEQVQKELPYEKDLPLRFGKKVVNVNNDIKKYLDNLLVKEDKNDFF
jgi:hypothetical protein